LREYLEQYRRPLQPFSVGRVRSDGSGLTVAPSGRERASIGLPLWPWPCLRWRGEPQHLKRGKWLLSLTISKGLLERYLKYIKKVLFLLREDLPFLEGVSRFRFLALSLRLPSGRIEAAAGFSRWPCALRWLRPCCCPIEKGKSLQRASVVAVAVSPMERGASTLEAWKVVTFLYYK